MGGEPPGRHRFAADLKPATRHRMNEPEDLAEIRHLGFSDKNEPKP